jgi:hypothetical protein
MPPDTVAAVLVAGGLISGALVAGSTRAPLEGLKTLLDFLLAAGLLRLGHAHSWTDLALAALVIGIRRLAGAGLRTARGVAGRAASAADGVAADGREHPGTRRQ